MILERISLKTAKYLKDEHPSHPATLEEITFSLTLIYGTLTTLASACVVGLLLGQFTEVMVVLFAFAVLRAISGGYHLQSALGCVVATVGFSAILSYSSYSTPIIIAVTVASLLLILLFAPSNIENQTRIPPRYNPLLKLVALALVGMNLFVQSPLLASAFALQSLLLIRRRRR